MSGLRINTNVTAMNAMRNVESVSTKLSTSIERLSSGLRINNAADDPAGLIISENLRAQVDGLNQAIDNAQDANNLIKTAEGGLTEINSLLRSIRQLAVHASNTGVNDSTSVQADQTQIASALDSINRIATQTQFGTKRLLDGTSGITSAVIDTTDVAGINIGGTFNNATIQAGVVTMTVNASATRATLTGNTSYTSATATLGVGKGGTIVLNGQSIKIDDTDTVQAMIDKINNVANTTGVGASFDGTNVILTQQSYGSHYKIDLSDSSQIINSAAANVGGTDAHVTVTAMALNAAGAPVVTTALFTGGVSNSDSGLKLTDSNGNTLLLTESGNDTAVSGKAVATITAAALRFQIGANAGQFVSQSLGNVQTGQLGTTAVGGGTSLATINVTTGPGATNAIKIVDEAIQQVTNLRAQLGAFQKNTLDSTISFLGVGVENLSASESQIRDTDTAAEVVNLTKNQILQQAGMSVLGQANQLPQQVLKLLQQ